MANTLLYLVIYDMEDDRLRKKVSDTLIRYGYERIQYSVFCGTENPRSLPAVWNALQEHFDPLRYPNDSLCVIRQKKSYFREMLTMGQRKVDLPWLMGETNTLII